MSTPEMAPLDTHMLVGMIAPRGWSQPLQNNIQRFLTKSEDTPGVFKPEPSQASLLETWKHWETPSLL